MRSIQRITAFCVLPSLALGLGAHLGVDGPAGEEVLADHHVESDQEERVERTWHAKLGELAPDFELADTSGKRWKLSDQHGKLVVLEWFNPECPVVQKAHAEGGSLAGLGNEVVRDGVVWVAINSGAPGGQGTGADRNASARERLGLEYPILLDESGWVGRMYEATNTPQMYVIDKQGKLAYRGAHESKQGEFLVKQALQNLASGEEITNPRTQAFGCSVKYARQAGLGQVAPDFELQSFSGEKQRLSDLRGNYVVLEWFNPGCPVVKKAHQPGGTLETAARRQAAEGVKWLAINSGAPGKQGTTESSNLDAKKRWKMSHPILIDSEGEVGRLYEAKTTPQMVVLDPRGVVIYAGAHQDRSGETLYVDQALAEHRAGEKVSTPSTRSFGCSVKYAD